MDTSWAAVGSTKIGGEVLSASLTYNSGLTPLYTMTDDGGGFGYSDISYNAADNGWEFEMTALVEDADADLFATCRTAASAQSLLAFRVKLPTTLASRYVQISFLARITDAWIDDISDDNGTQVVNIKCQETTDGTDAFEVVVANDQAAQTG